MTLRVGIWPGMSSEGPSGTSPCSPPPVTMNPPPSGKALNTEELAQHSSTCSYQTAAGPSGAVWPTAMVCLIVTPPQPKKLYFLYLMTFGLSRTVVCLAVSCCLFPSTERIPPPSPALHSPLCSLSILRVSRRPSYKPSVSCLPKATQVFPTGHLPYLSFAGSNLCLTHHHPKTPPP